MPEHILDQLTAVVAQRRAERPDGSYVVRLLDGAPDLPAAKVIEEAGELADAARAESDDAVVHEAADLLFHALVLVASRDIPTDRIWAELGRRFGIGGLDEKANRPAKD